jgi:hypothetical protein
MKLIQDLFINIFYSTYYEEQRVIDRETEKPIAKTVNLYRINRLTGQIHYVRSWSEYNLTNQPHQNLLAADESDDKLIISATLEEM